MNCKLLLQKVTIATFLFSTLMLLSASSRAQRSFTDVRGVVHDESDKPVIGASVVIRNTSTNFTTGTKTDTNGIFTVRVPAGGPYKFSFSNVGFTTQVLSGYHLKDSTAFSLDVTMKAANSGLDSIVVVGYGTQKKLNLTGAVEVVKGTELINRPTPTLSQALQGKVTGVTFATGSYGFEPGASLNLQIRGQGTPLIIVDGVAVNSLDGINPNDVESISLLKDAAASAIYGARAPYGVLLITTKSGGADGKLHVQYNGLFTTMKPLNMPHDVDSYTTALAMNEASDNTGIAHVYTDATIDRILAYQASPTTTAETVPNPSNPALWADGVLGNANYDWFNVFYGQGHRQQHNISVNGGNKGVSFFVSGGYNYDGGLLQVGDDTYDRYNFRSKVDANLNKWMKFTSNTRYYNSSRITPAYDNQGDYDLLFHQVARTFPSQPMKSPNGVYRVQSKIPWTKDAGTNSITINDIVQQFAVQITPSKGWTINGDYGIDLTHTAYDSKNYTVYEDDVAGNPVVSGSTSNPYVEKSRNLTFYQSFNVYSTYKFTLAAKHNFSVMAGFQQEWSNNDYVYAKQTGLITSSVPTMNTSTGIQYAKDSLGKYATQGVFSRINYNFNNKYLLEFDARYDGTYKFADGKKWGFFPSASAGWNVSNEAFWEGIKHIVNNFKIRGSYGSLGNQLTASPYQDIPLLAVNSNVGWIVNGIRPSYVTASGLINPEVTWETSNSSDLGVDISVLNSRLTFTGDIYQRRTKKQLRPQAAVPAVIGVTSLPQANNRETKTNGWELSLGWKDKIGSDFSYSVVALLSDYQTTVTKYNNPTKILTTSYAGQKIGEIWGLVSKGLINDQATADAINQNKKQQAVSGQTWNKGDVEYVDINGDGVINFGSSTVNDPGDRRIIGNTTPRYQYGLTLNAQWKGFDVTMFWQGVGKRDLAVGFSGATNMMWGFTTSVQSSVFPAQLDYYRDATAGKYSGLGPNENAYYARPYLNANMNAKNQVLQTRYLLNGAYARLKNLQVGYHFSDQLLHKVKLQGLYLYCTGENLATICHLPSQFDPETASVGVRGDGKSFFPSTAYSFGLNLTF